MKLRLVLATICYPVLAALCASAALSSTAVMSRSKSASELPSCGRDSLPAELQHQLEASFSSWKIQNGASVSRFQADNRNCLKSS
jgi:hypothetical protein